MGMANQCCSLNFFLIPALSFLSPGASAFPMLGTNRVTILYDAFGSRRGLTRDWGFCRLRRVGGQTHSLRHRE